MNYFLVNLIKIRMTSISREKCYLNGFLQDDLELLPQYTVADSADESLLDPNFLRSVNPELDMDEVRAEFGLKNRDLPSVSDKTPDKSELQCHPEQVKQPDSYLHVDVESNEVGCYLVCIDSIAKHLKIHKIPDYEVEIRDIITKMRESELSVSDIPKSSEEGWLWINEQFGIQNGSLGSDWNKIKLCLKEELTVICLDTQPKKNYLYNLLIETFTNIPDSSNIIIYSKIHGSSKMKKDSTDEFLYTIKDHFPVESSEIINAVSYGRNVKAFNICGLIHSCYGSFYTKLNNCFDISISPNISVMGSSPQLIHNILKYVENSKYESFHDDFENDLFNKFSDGLGNILWALGEIEEKTEKFLEIFKNDGQRLFSNFMKIWKNTFPDDKYTQSEQLFFRNTLISLGYDINVLIYNVNTVKDFKKILEIVGISEFSNNNKI